LSSQKIQHIRICCHLSTLTVRAAMSDTNRTAVEALDPEWAAESNTARILAVVTVFHALALLFVGLRVYARLLVVKTPGLDDLMIVLSGLCALGGWIIFVIQANHGLGKHYKTISEQDYMMFQKVGFWQSIISAGLAFMWLKISIALNLLRLSKNMTQRKWYKWALWIMIGVTSIYCVGGTLPFFLRCRPMEGYWDKNIKPAPTCMSIKTFIIFSIVNTAFNIGTDVIFATLPTPIVWSLQMKRKARLYVIGILSLGYIAVIMGIIKSKYQLALEVDKDKTFNQNIQVLGFLQLQLGIIAACAPALRPLFGKILRLSFHGGTTNHGYSERSFEGQTNSGGRSNAPGWELRKRTSEELILLKSITRTTKITVVDQKSSERQVRDVNAEGMIFPGRYPAPCNE
ncbi:integral membrane protein, partial [Colletotrichum incanum]